MNLSSRCCLAWCALPPSQPLCIFFVAGCLTASWAAQQNRATCDIDKDYPGIDYSDVAWRETSPTGTRAEAWG